MDASKKRKFVEDDVDGQSPSRVFKDKPNQSAGTKARPSSWNRPKIDGIFLKIFVGLDLNQQTEVECNP